VKRYFLAIIHRIKLLKNLIIPPKLKQKLAESYWSKSDDIYTGKIAPDIFKLATENIDKFDRILEFGSNNGSNLEFFIKNMKDISVLGIDVNPIVKDLEHKYSNYTGEISNEKILDNYHKNEFSLSYTSSVLDHIANEEAVIKTLKKLAHISEYVIINEPHLTGVVGDVSEKFRYQVKSGLENSHKVFAKYSYFWDYDKYLKEMGLDFKKIPNPMHRFSMGPYYYLYFFKSKEYEKSQYK
tara:strand:- start:147 stop:866 length:720 start_codon:yes stop_codon:yes gene_type:complete